VQCYFLQIIAFLSSEQSHASIDLGADDTMDEKMANDMVKAVAKKVSEEVIDIIVDIVSVLLILCLDYF
jgi:hypothetical protein